MAFFIALVDTKVNGVVTGTQTVRIPYDGNAYSCAQEESLVNGLTTQQKETLISQSLPTAPQPPSGYRTESRDCGGSTSSWETDTDNGPSLIS